MTKPQNDSAMDHPCKETCSGWQQGFEQGRKHQSESLRILAEGMEDAENALAVAHDNIQDYFENRCIPTEHELENIVLFLREARAKIAAVKARGDWPLEGK